MLRIPALIERLRTKAAKSVDLQSVLSLLTVAHGIEAGIEHGTTPPQCMHPAYRGVCGVEIVVTWCSGRGRRATAVNHEAARTGAGRAQCGMQVDDSHHRHHRAVRLRPSMHAR